MALCTPPEFNFNPESKMTDSRVYLVSLPNGLMSSKAMDDG